MKEFMSRYVAVKAEVVECCGPEYEGEMFFVVTKSPVQKLNYWKRGVTLVTEAGVSEHPEVYPMTAHGAVEYFKRRS